MVNKLVYGVAVMDADYKTYLCIDGKNVWVCPFYKKWFSMIVRCYSKKHHEKYKSYKGCTVCEEWLTFSNFKSWMEQQDWHGNELDKDILHYGNKIYSPEKCLFVTKVVNNFFAENRENRGDYMIGVSYHKSSGKLRSTCSNPITRKSEHIGLFDCEMSAHMAWRKRKLELAIEIASTQKSKKVGDAIILRCRRYFSEIHLK